MGTLVKAEVATPKRRKHRNRTKKSIVWEHFTIINVGDDCLKASCNQCKKTYAYITGPKMSGTSHLKRHIDTGTCSITRLKDKNLIPGWEPPKKRQRATNGALAIPFSQQSCNNEIAKMIILHDYPLEMVEHPGFIQFVKTLQPQFETVSSNAIYDECMAIFSNEKSTLANTLSEIPGRISLSLDMWTSDETLGYAVLSGHFIDNDWKLHRRLLNVVTVPFPDSEKAFNHAILSCLSDWGVEAKLFALTLDRSIANETAIDSLRSLLSINNPHMLNGQFLIGSCFARILTSLALDSINAMYETVERVRNSVKFVKTSEANEEKFMEIKARLQVPSNKSLVIDNCTRWDSTYHMLCAASELKEVFLCLDTHDKPYKNLSLEEWRQIETLCDYLNCLYEASGVVTAQRYPTADKFFTQVCNIQIKLFNSLMSEDPFTSNLVKPLIEKFENYWKDCSFVLAMAVVMDPRYKLKLVGDFFSQLYREQAESFLSTVKDAINSLYLEYVAESLPLLSFDIDERDDEEEKTTTGDQEQKELFDTACEDPFFDIYISDISTDEHIKSELDHYLEEHLHPEQEDFNMLEWWKMNKIRYPTLSNMAADLLSMPLSTVPSDSVFDTVSKKVDSYRGSLIKLEAIEAFACAKDWLRAAAVSEKEF